eukprot:COSAG02_NODE_28_length_51367_cov_70.053932_22_plen_162_part_00
MATKSRSFCPFLVIFRPLNDPTHAPGKPMLGHSAVPLVARSAVHQGSRRSIQRRNAGKGGGGATAQRTRPRTSRSHPWLLSSAGLTGSCHPTPSGTSPSVFPCSCCRRRSSGTHPHRCRTAGRPCARWTLHGARRRVSSGAHAHGASGGGSSKLSPPPRQG